MTMRVAWYSAALSNAYAGSRYFSKFGSVELNVYTRTSAGQRGETASTFVAFCLLEEMCGSS